MNKYENWSKVLIEPSSLNDARLYSLETRIHQEEDSRVKEIENLKDVFKKLIYSMQQNEMDEQQDEKPGMLPTLYPGSTKRNGNLNQSFNFEDKPPAPSKNMMLKRLNFIKNNLDTLEVNESGQMASNDTKSKRIWELWKNDENTPSVREVLDHMRKLKEKENKGKTSNQEFDKILNQMKRGSHENLSPTSMTKSIHGSHSKIDLKTTPKANRQDSGHKNFAILSKTESSNLSTNFLKSKFLSQKDKVKLRNNNNTILDGKINI